jgi:hypothetical protein
MLFAGADGQEFPGLIDLVDFKWMMAGEGHVVHLERLQSDPVYALQCLQRGLAARCEPLRLSAQRLIGALRS